MEKRATRLNFSKPAILLLSFETSILHPKEVEPEGGGARGRRSPKEVEPEGGGAWHPSGEKIELLVSWGRTPEPLEGSTLNPLQRPPLLTSCQEDPSCLLSQA